MLKKEAKDIEDYLSGQFRVDFTEDKNTLAKAADFLS